MKNTDIGGTIVNQCLEHARQTIRDILVDQNGRFEAPLIIEFVLHVPDNPLHAAVVKVFTGMAAPKIPDMVAPMDLVTLIFAIQSAYDHRRRHLAARFKLHHNRVALPLNGKTLLHKVLPYETDHFKSKRHPQPKIGEIDNILATLYMAIPAGALRS